MERIRVLNFRAQRPKDREPEARIERTYHMTFVAQTIPARRRDDGAALLKRGMYLVLAAVAANTVEILALGYDGMIASFEDDAHYYFVTAEISYVMDTRASMG